MVLDKAWGIIDDTFSGEKVNPYKANKAAFDYRGGGEGYYHNLADNAQGRKGPQADMAGYDQFRGLGLQSRNDINQQVTNLRQQSHDPQYSVAQNQLRQGQDQNMQQALAVARAGGGSGAQQAQALRQAQFQNAQSNQAANAQAATLRAGEVQAANQQISGLLAQQRAMDLQAAGLDAQTALSQAQLELQQGALNDRFALGLYGMGQQGEMAAMQGRMGYEQLMAQQQLGSQMANAQMDAQRDGSLLNMAATFGAAGILASDVRGKQEVEDVNKSLSYGDALKQTAGLSSLFGGGGQMWSQDQMMQYSDERSKSEIAALRAERDSYKGALEDITGRGKTLANAGRVIKAVYGGPPALAAALHEKLDNPEKRERQAAHLARTVTGPMPVLRKVAPQVAAQAPPAPQPVAQPAPAPQPAVVTPAMVYSDERSKARIAELEGQLAVFQQASERPELRAPNTTALDASYAGGERSERGWQAPPWLEEQLRDERRRAAPPLDAPPWLRDSFGARPSVAAFADIPTKSFRYREPFASEYGADRRVGVMAQDLERNPLTAAHVKQMPNGLKGVDSGQLTMTNTGMISEVARDNLDIRADVEEIRNELQARDELDEAERRGMGQFAGLGRLKPMVRPEGF